MNQTNVTVVPGSAFGSFLDDLPKALYVLAHMAFVAVAVWLWARAGAATSPGPVVLSLYIASQVGFFAFFANWITFKMAVLAEQTLVFAMVCLILLG
jgi:hypothetical protein